MLLPRVYRSGLSQILREIGIWRLYWIPREQVVHGHVPDLAGLTGEPGEHIR